jgi:hypothetical protein
MEFMILNILLNMMPIPDPYMILVAPDPVGWYFVERPIYNSMQSAGSIQ